MSATGLSWNTSGMRRVRALGPSNTTRPDRVASWSGTRPSHTW